MPYPIHILVNDFAIRSFHETADKDYIVARMAYRARANTTLPMVGAALLGEVRERHSYTQLGITVDRERLFRRIVNTDSDLL